MFDLKLFTDGSVNGQSKLGYGAYLLVAEPDRSVEHYKSQVKTKRFEQTSSTKLELQTLLWALKDIFTLVNEKDTNLTIYTDCQNIIGLPARQARLEQSQYLSGNKKPLNHRLLYKEFYQLTSGLKYTFLKVVGHQSSSQKDRVDNLFSLVDKASRQALRTAN